MYDIAFRPAQISDISAIWDIILFAKEVRKREGSSQWQDGYPDIQTIETDIADNMGQLLLYKG